MSDNNCKFCRIANHNASSVIIYEDNDVMAFLDIRPLFHGHTLLITKQHYETFYDLPDTLRDKFFAQAKIIGKAVEESMEAEGSFLAMNNIVSQSIPHLHLHVVPRKKGDGLKGFFWPRTTYQDTNEAEIIKEKIKSRLGIYAHLPKS